MAYPYAIGDHGAVEWEKTTFPEYFSADIGPFYHNGNRYLVTAQHNTPWNNSDRSTPSPLSYMRVMKSTDEGQTWAQVGTSIEIATQVSSADDFQANFDCEQTDSIISIVYLTNTRNPVTGVFGTGRKIGFVGFDMSTDTLGTPDEDGPYCYNWDGPSVGPESSVHLVFNGARHVIVYQSRPEDIGGQDYDRVGWLEYSEGFGPENVVGAGEERYYYVSGAVVDENLDVHALGWHTTVDEYDAAQGNLWHMTIAEGSGAGALTTIATDAMPYTPKVTHNPIIVGNVIYYPYIRAMGGSGPSTVSNSISVMRADASTLAWTVEDISTDITKYGYRSIGYASVALAATADESRLYAFSIGQIETLYRWERTVSGWGTPTALATKPDLEHVTAASFSDRVGVMFGQSIDSPRNCWYYEFSPAAVAGNYCYGC
jgi:hypothetical protein